MAEEEGRGGGEASEAEALDTLRSLGYLNISGLSRGSDGSWTARAQSSFDGPFRAVQLHRDGTVTER